MKVISTILFGLSYLSINSQSIDDTLQLLYTKRIELEAQTLDISNKIVNLKEKTNNR